jgi:chemotaxis regulatin CheY-phosphate phosphatase CheZ
MSNDIVNVTDAARILGVSDSHCRELLKEFGVPIASEFKFGRGTMRLYKLADVQNAIPQARDRRTTIVEKMREHAYKKLNAGKASKHSEQLQRIEDKLDQLLLGEQRGNGQYRNDQPAT